MSEETIADGEHFLCSPSVACHEGVGRRSSSSDFLANAVWALGVGASGKHMA